MKRIDKPWGHEIIWAHTRRYVGKILHIKEGHQLSKQYHQTKEETIYVLKGVLYNYDLDDNVNKVQEGESFHILPHQVHRFAAPEGTVELVEVSTPQLEDVVRIEDDYDRQ